MKFPQNIPQQAQIWFNRAFIYFSLCRTAGKFCGEFNWIRMEIGLINKPKLKPKQDNI